MYASDRTSGQSGLGIWGQIAAIVGTYVAPKIADWAGGDDNVPDGIYHSQAKLGVIYCAGPWDVAVVREALENNPSHQIQLDVAQYFLTGVPSRDVEKWARYGQPRTALERAGAIVAEAHGGSDCNVGPEEGANALVSRILEVERARRLAEPTIAERLTGGVQTQPVPTTVVTTAYGETVGAVVTSSGEVIPVTEAVVTGTGQVVRRDSGLPVIIPGVDTKWLLGGAGALAVLMLLKS